MALKVKLYSIVSILFAEATFCIAQSSDIGNEIEETTETKVEKSHELDSALLLMIIGLLIATILTAWLFKVKRFRYMHETGLSMIYGMIIGAIIKYRGGVTQTGYHVPNALNVSKAPKTLWVNTSDHAQYSYSLRGLLFTTQKGGGELEQMAVFDPEIFFYVLLPPIIFFAGYDMKKRFFFRNIGAILMYAFIGTTISCMVFGSLIYAFIKMVPSPLFDNFDFLRCLLFGSLISATDPVTVLAIFHDLHVDVDLYALVFGESVMNDAVAIVLYRSIESYSSQTFDGLSFFKAIGEFIAVFGGSFLIGGIMGLGTALLTKLTNIKQFPRLETALFCLMSYSTFLIAEVAGLTGIVAVLFCGISQAHYTYNNMSPQSQVATKEIFGFLNFIAENFIFSYMGLAVFTFNQHQWNPGFISYSFFALAISRFLNIYPLSFILNLGRSRKISANFQHTLFFSGLRGAVAFALAIRNTSSIPRQLMLTSVLMVVLVTVIFNGGLTTQALRKLNISVGVDPEQELVRGEEEPNSEFRDQSHFERSWWVRHWHNFDLKYMKPLFTNKGPPLIDVLPSCCAPLARCLSRSNSTDEPRELQVDIDMDDDLLSLDGQMAANSPEIILERDAGKQQRGFTEEESSDLASTSEPHTSFQLGFVG